MRRVEFILVSVFVSWITMNLYPAESIQDDFGQLRARGLTYRLSGNEMVEIENHSTGEQYRLPLGPRLTPREPLHSGLPTLTVNLTTIDTGLYNWKYHYLNTIPVSGNWGFALQSSDLDHNLRAEVYGLYHDSSGYGTRICEIDENNQWVTVYTYPVQIGVIDNIADIDLNGLNEVYGSNGDTVYVYEQAGMNGLPIINKFRFRRYYFSAFGIPMMVYDMDRNGKKDLVYRGSEPDTVQQTNVDKIYVAEYDSTINNFRPIWGENLPPGCVDLHCSLNLSTGDFDGDGFKDIVTSAFQGNAYVIECTNSDSFSVVWFDSLSVAGRVAAGDVDGNGVEEFFVGGNQLEGDGYVHMRIFACEKTSDNQYEPYYSFDIFPVGYFFVDLYQTVDIDNDGRRELLLSFGGGDIIIKGDAPHEYSLFYYTPVSSSDGFSAGDVNNDSIPELFIGQFLADEPIVRKTQVYYLDSSFTHVEQSHREGVAPQYIVLESYPNPFNPGTTLKYALSRFSHVRVAIYDIMGKEVITLLDDERQPGQYTVTWTGTRQDGQPVSSGVYMVRLAAHDQVKTRKLLLLR